MIHGHSAPSKPKSHGIEAVITIVVVTSIREVCLYTKSKQTLILPGCRRIRVEKRPSSLITAGWIGLDTAGVQHHPCLWYRGRGQYSNVLRWIANAYEERGPRTIIAIPINQKVSHYPGWIVRESTMLDLDQQQGV